MSKELFDELKEIAKEYNVSTNAFNSITRRVLEMKEFSETDLSENQVYEVIKESIQNYDHKYAPMGYKGNERKSIEQTVDLAINKVVEYSKPVPLDYDYSDDEKNEEFLKHF